MRRVALYVRVSTAYQTTENQEGELTAIAARMGWEVVCTYRDDGISGSKGRDKRPALNAMLKDVTRRTFDMSWRGPWTGSGGRYKILSASSRICTRPELTYSCISKGSTLRRPRAAPCSRCPASVSVSR
jgi:hypothetical protein